MIFLTAKGEEAFSCWLLAKRGDSGSGLGDSVVGGHYFYGCHIRKKKAHIRMMTMGLNIECRLTNNE